MYCEIIGFSTASCKYNLVCVSTYRVRYLFARMFYRSTRDATIAMATSCVTVLMNHERQHRFKHFCLEFPIKAETGQVTPIVINGGDEGTESALNKLLAGDEKK